MWSKERNRRVGSNTSKEELNRLKQRPKDSPIVRAELEESHTLIHYIGLIGILKILEFNCELFLPEYLLEMIDISSTNEEDILTQPWSLIVWCNNHWERIEIILRWWVCHFKINSFKAQRFDSHLWALLCQRAKISLPKLKVVRSGYLSLAFHLTRL